MMRHVRRFALAVRRALIAVWAAADFDATDAAFFGGLALAALGGWSLSSHWTLITIGAVLVLKAAGGLRGILWPSSSPTKD